MRGDSSGRNRSALLTRWRGALRVVRERESFASPPIEPAPAVTGAAAELELALATADDAASFNRFEMAILSAVARPMADKLIALLAPSRAAVLTERNAATCAASLVQLDLLEDVLDALLLVNAAAGDGAEPGSAAR